MLRKNAAEILFPASVVLFMTFSLPVFSLGGPGIAGGSSHKKIGKAGKQITDGKTEKEGGGEESTYDDNIESAVLHFKKGVDFYEEGNINAALAEFLKSYEFVPNVELRYNIGICYLETGKLVEALDQFRKYIEEEGDGLPWDTRKEVECVIAEIMNKIGYLLLECDEADAGLEIDGFHEYRTPLNDTLALVLGLHVIIIKKPGFETYKKEFFISSGEITVLKVHLKPVEGHVKKGKKPKRWLWAALGAGSLLGAAAGASGIVALIKKNDMIKAVDDCTKTMTRNDCPKAYKLQDEGESWKLATNILATAAATAAITGMILFILDKPRSIEKEPNGMKVKGDGGTNACYTVFITGGSSGLGMGAVIKY